MKGISRFSVFHRPQLHPAHRMAILNAGVLLVATLGTTGCASTASSAPPAPQSPPQTASAWSLVWSDEFSGAKGSRPNPKYWNTDLGNADFDGWGNKELQFYTDRQSNARLDGNGHLEIVALRNQEKLPCWNNLPCPYTSARPTTLGKVEFTYGKVEARIRVPSGQGLLPAFWSLGKSEWPNGGEMDIMEAVAETPNTVYGTLHGPGYSDEQGLEGTRELGAPLSGEYHTYTLIKRPKELIWLVDGQQFHRVTPKDLPAGKTWVFEQPYYLLLNVAVGGNWPGTPSATATFPQVMNVDYVRIWKELR